MRSTSSDEEKRGVYLQCNQQDSGRSLDAYEQKEPFPKRWPCHSKDKKIFRESKRVFISYHSKCIHEAKREKTRALHTQREIIQQYRKIMPAAARGRVKRMVGKQPEK
jgi:hypothetical protein